MADTFYKTLFAVALAGLACSVSAQQQQTPDEVPPGPQASAQGDAMIQKEFEHQQRIVDLSRDIETATAEVKLAEQQRAKFKLDHPDEDSGGKGGSRRIPPMDSTSIPGYGMPQGGNPYAAMPVTSPMIPMVGGPGAMGVMPSTSFGAPELMGVVGEAAVFRIDGNFVRAAAGEKAGNYKVKTISGRTVVLSGSERGSELRLVAPN